MKRIIWICAFFFSAVFVPASCDVFGNREPVVKVTAPGGQVIAESGGGICSFDFEIENRVDGAVVILEIPESCSWISGPEVVFDGASGTVTVSLLENLDTDARNEFLTLKYLYGDMQTVTSVAGILQKGRAYDYVTEGISGISFYYGAGMTDVPNLRSYYLRIADCDLAEDDRVNASVYSFDLYHKRVTDDRLPAPGLYTMVATGSETDLCFTDGNTIFEKYGEDSENFSDYEQSFFKNGSVNIEKDGTVYNIMCALEDEDGKTHLVRYNGELVLEDMTALSRLKGDLELDITGYVVYATCLGDYFGIGFNKWDIQVVPEDIEEGDPFMKLELLAPVGVDAASGLSEPLEFESANTMNPDVKAYFMPGQYGYLLSWFMTYGGVDGSGEAVVTSPCAPFTDGMIYITPNGDGTVNFSTDAEDDIGNRMIIRGSNLAVEYNPGL